MAYLHKKQNINFNFKSHTAFVFLPFMKIYVFKAARHFNVSQHTKFHSPMLIGASFESTSEVLSSSILEW
jgi:hypothetical protein